MKYRTIVVYGVFLVLLIPLLAQGEGLTEHDAGGVTHWSQYGLLGSVQSEIELLSTMEPVYELPVPILFGTEVSDLSDNFGEPRSGGRLHEGHDTHAPKGTPIVSPTRSVVTRMVTWDSAGLAVYTANPGGETYVYMHLDRFAEGLAVGDILDAGDWIGYVGNTGNALGAGDHLHFEIRRSDGPIDPLPRLVRTFTLEEKIASLSKHLPRIVNKDAFVHFIATTFGDELREAEALGITIPFDALEVSVEEHEEDPLPLSSPGASPESETSLPSLDLEEGDTGQDVMLLQKFLVQANTGEHARYLARSGATGYFGPVTRRALAEYQASVGIVPSSGFYGPLTRAYRESQSLAVVGSIPADDADGGALGSRDLEIRDTGDDVLALQRFLNSQGVYVALEGTGSPGYESTYFGTRTQDALVRFQKMHGITPSAGYYGPRTRALMSTF